MLQSNANEMSTASYFVHVFRVICLQSSSDMSRSWNASDWSITSTLNSTTAHDTKRFIRKLTDRSAEVKTHNLAAVDGRFHLVRVYSTRK